MSRRESDARDAELHAFLRQAITRRGFLQRGALGAGGLVLGGNLLAACGGAKRARGRRRRRRPPTVSSGKTLRISNWPLYIDKQTVPDFEKATGIKTEYTEDINDNGEFFAKIDEPLKRNQSIDRDIIVLTDWMAGRLISLGYAAPLDDAKFPNKANLVDNVQDVSFDPGRKYSVPWLSGMTGLGYNPKKTGRELTSINDIFDPKFKGQVTMLTEMRDTIGLVMLGLGRDPPRPPRPTRGGLRRRSRRRGKTARSASSRATTTPKTWQRATSPSRSPGRATSRGWRRTTRISVDRAQGRRHALLGQHADPEDLRPAGPGDGVDRTTCTMPAHSAQIVAGAPYLSAAKGTGASWRRSRPTSPAARWSIRPTISGPGCTCSGR